MRYIGGKSLIIDKIDKTISEIIGWKNVHSCIDIFAGSAIVSQFFKSKNCDVVSNDFMFFSTAINKGTVGLDSIPSFSKLDFDQFKYLNNIDVNNSLVPLENLFIYNNYSPNENCSRMYFQNKNAKKIDLVRLQIEEWKNEEKINTDEYFYLLASLLLAVPYVANITGVYAAYLKFWDKRTYKDIELLPPPVLVNKSSCVCTNLPYQELLSCEKDLLYADPPYNSREYLPNYHIMETIAKYDYPEIHGKTGMRGYEEQKSPFCKKKLVARAFETLVKETHCNKVLISYNNEGLLDTKTLSEICQDYSKKDTFRLIEFPYRRYKSKIKNDASGLKEQLYYFEKR